MFGKLTAVISALALVLLCAGGATAEGPGGSPAVGGLAAIGTAFTYQGQLQSGGAPVNGTCDFQFSLWDAAGSGTPPTGGNQAGALQPAPSIPVSNGLFAVRLDFGSDAFRGEARWLQTAVRCPAGGGAYTTLAPRQALTPVPYAMYSQDLGLPFQKGINSPSRVFEVRNDGGAGAAITAESSGSGRALEVFADGTADAAFFGINDPANGGTVVNARTVGTGLAASFRIENTLNTHSALGASTDGSGPAGSFNTSGSGTAVTAAANGSGRALQAVNFGTGDAAWLSIDNPDNPSDAISVRTKGTGRAAAFWIANAANTQSVLTASTNGSGEAGKFTANGSGAAIAAWSFGSGRALNAEVRGTGGVAFFNIDNPNNTDALINAQTNGLGGGAGFRINNPLNTAPALYASTDGSGSAIKGHAYGSGEAVAGWSWGSNWAATFHNEGSGGGVFISSPGGTTGLTVSGGSKNAVVATSEGARLLYTEESSAVWFTDYGFGRLTGGSAFITIDPLFAETVNLDEPYHVFVQAYGDAELYVGRRTPLGFEVRLRAGEPGVEFSYRLVATRRGYEGKRLERAPWADGDPNLYPAQPAAPEKGGPK